jgi:hypothetical protein
MKRSKQSTREFRKQRKLACGIKRGVSKYAAKVAARVEIVIPKPDAAEKAT